MHYTHSHKITFRIPYNSERIGHKSSKGLKLGMDLKINFGEGHETKVIEIEKNAIQNLKTGKLKRLSSFIKEVSSEDGIPSSIWLVPSDFELNFYHTIDQSLEITNFSPFFKSLVHNTFKRDVVFENRGDEPITIYSALSDHLFFYFKKENFPVTLNRGEQKKMILFFEPKQPGLVDCTLQIETSILNHTQITYRLTGSASYSRSYYKVINGVRYDRELLDQAMSCIYKSPGKQLELKDVQLLVLFATDAHRFTPVEKRTFNYILENLRCSEEARTWLSNDEVMRISRLSNYQISAYWLNTKDLFGNSIALSLKEIASKEFNLDRLQISVLEEEALNQNKNYKNKISIEQAFRKSLISFLEDASDAESPRKLMIERDSVLARNRYEDEESYLKAVKDRMLFHMNQGRIKLVYQKYDRDVAGSSSPEGGESRKENWVFRMTLYSFSDHIYWSVVNRNTGRTKNYGFN